MTQQHAQFTGSIPDHYDHGLGPHIFTGYAAELAARIGAHTPKRLLELAAGTGIVTRQIRDALPAESRIVCTDLNAAMLEVAKRKFAADDNIDYRPADATDLPFDDASFDLVGCQFGVMFFPDKDQGYRESFRVLAPGGHYLFNVWHSHAHNPFARVAQEVLTTFFGDDTPGFYEVPFHYHEQAPIEESLTAAGFENIQFESIPLEVTIEDTDRFARGIVYGNPVIAEIEERGTTSPDEIMDALIVALDREFGKGPGRMPLRAMFVSAQKPAA